MRSTRCWLTAGVLVVATSSSSNVKAQTNYDPGQDYNNDQSEAVPNSWNGNDFGYADQNGYELSVQPDLYKNDQLDPAQIQEFNDYVDELDNLQNLMEQGYGSDYDSYLDRNNEQSDYQLDSNESSPDYPAIDYNDLEFPSMSSTTDQESYPSPPNPCPKGVKAKNCIKDMPDTAEFSQMYQAINKNGEGSKMNADLLNSFFQAV